MRLRITQSCSFSLSFLPPVICNRSTERHLPRLTETRSRRASLQTFNGHERRHGLRCSYQRPKHLCYQKTTNNKDKTLLMGTQLISLLALYTLIIALSSVPVNVCQAVTERWSGMIMFRLQIIYLKRMQAKTCPSTFIAQMSLNLEMWVKRLNRTQQHPKSL